MIGRVGAHPKNLAVKLTKSLLDLSAEEGSTLHMGGRGGGGGGRSAPSWTSIQKVTLEKPPK